MPAAGACGSREVSYLQCVTHADKLRVILDDLHQELAAAPAGDPAVRNMLSRSLTEISQKLTSNEDGPLLLTDDIGPEQLRAAARVFEAEHPKLAQTIESLVDALARMGI
jgi:hypothetical protein